MLSFQFKNYVLRKETGRFQWPHRLRRGSCCRSFVDCVFDSCRGHGCASVVDVVCCQGSPTECVSLCVIRCCNNNLRLKRIGRRDQTKKDKEGRQAAEIDNKMTILTVIIIGFDVATTILFFALR